MRPSGIRMAALGAGLAVIMLGGACGGAPSTPALPKAVGAIEELDRSLAARPHAAETLALRANACQNAGDRRQGVADAELALFIEPLAAEALYIRGVFHSQDHRFDAAVRDLELSVKVEPFSAYALEMLGTVHTMRGRYDEAIPILRAALSEEEKLPGATYRLGVCLYAKHDPDAKAVFSRYLAIETDTSSFGKFCTDLARAVVEDRNPSLPDLVEPLVEPARPPAAS